MGTRRRDRRAVIPQRPDELTAEWFTAALADRSSGAAIEAVRIDVIGTDVGFAGEVYRCHLDWTSGAAPTAPRSVVVKVPAANPKNRASAEAVGAYEREIRVYRDLGGRYGLPMPEHLHSEMTPNPAPWLEGFLIALFARTPIRLLAWLTRAALGLAARSRRRYVLVLEDIPDARGPAQRDGGTTDDAVAALAVLARFHAANWMDRDLIDAHPYIGSTNRVPRLVQAAYLRNRDDFVARFADHLDTATIAQLDRTQEQLPAFLDHLAAAPWTVLHGDFRLDNVLFRPSGELVVLDHQLPTHGRPAVDVAYFVTTALDARDRDGEAALLSAYHAALVEAGVTDLDLATLRADVAVATQVMVHGTVSFGEFIDTDLTDGDVAFADQMTVRLLGWLRRPA